MFLTTRGRYVIMAVISMYESAKHNKPIPIKCIAVEQGLSLPYMEQLFCSLGKAGIIKAVKGPGGGYIFAKNPEEITLNDLLDAVGENIEITKCGIEKVDFCKPNSEAYCNSHALWANLSAYILQYLTSTTIKDVVDKNFFFKI
jgi:Rrf2 family iron-sulfur cluster assembly transcriptional regulator